MTTFHYFAYGSNMLTARLRARCASAAFKTIARVTGHQLTYSKRSYDGSGKATLKPAEPDSTVTGVVFEIDRREADILHQAEGPGYAFIDDFLVTCRYTGATISTGTYIAFRHDHTIKPYDWYLALILAGVAEHNLGAEHAALHRSIAYDVDTDHERRERLIALEALEHTGVADYTALLSNFRTGDG